MSEKQTGFPLIMLLVVDRYLRFFQRPMMEEFPGDLWTFDVGEFAFQMNGNNEQVKGVPPFTVAIYLHGLPVAFVDPGGGVQMGGWDREDLGVEDAVIAALEAEFVASGN